MLVLLLSCTLIPFQATIIPAYLITAKLGLLNSYLGLALPLMSTIVCIFIFKASFEAVPHSLIDAARIDGLNDLRILMRVLLPLSTPAIATNVVLAFIWSWNNFMWPLIITRDPYMQTLPLGLPVPLLHGRHDRRALRFCRDGAGARAARVPDGAVVVHARPHRRRDQGLTKGIEMRWRRLFLNRFTIVAVAIAVAVGVWNLYVELHAHGLLAGRVVDAAGTPVAGATVVLSTHDFVTQVEKARTQTDASGDFRFTDNVSHLVQLQALDGKDASPKVTIRLWFRGQDRNVTEPLRLAGAG